MRVLLAEDEPDLQLITRMALEDAGHTVVAVSDGVALLEIARVGRYDVVLLDVMMPRMDGFSACAQLRSDPLTRDLPVIFLTARSQADEIERGLAYGALGYIVKPFDVFDLSAQIQAFLR